MILSRASEYAIRAMVYMAEKGGESPTQLKDIAESEGIPFHFLAKTMQVLTRIRLVKSFRGPRGGFTLMKRPDQIYLYEIVNAFDAISQWETTCILGINPCSDEVVCPIHEDWKPIKEEIFKMFQEKTLTDLVGQITAKREKLKELGLTG
ncbi:Rrf2 family transcriptional regulator [bacterium]|nr:Rrf2 family transcriptional regulator [bacterium]